MNSLSIFDFKNYKTYLTAVSAHAVGGKNRGMKSSLATAAGCQPAYLSRVFSGAAHLSLEQAEGISSYLGHSQDEERMFLTLLQYNRAGTKRLRDYFDRELVELRRARNILEVRFKVGNALSTADQQTYYSSWLYVAAHVLVSIPSLQTKEALSNHLGIPLRKIGEVLEFLAGTGLVEERDRRYTMGKTRVHLGNGSPLIGKHHVNWRIQAMRSLDRDSSRQDNEDLHYSSIVSLSAVDFTRLKSRLIEVIEEFNSVVKDSPEEAGACLALDFFGI